MIWVQNITYLPSILFQGWMVGILFSLIYIPVKREGILILSLTMREGILILSLTMRESILILSLSVIFIDR